MRLIGVWMVSVEQDHALPDQHLLQLGIRSGYLTVASRVPCAINVGVTYFETAYFETFVHTLKHLRQTLKPYLDVSKFVKTFEV